MEQLTVLIEARPFGVSDPASMDRLAESGLRVVDLPGSSSRRRA
jgi:hypothetical protein